MDSKKRNKSRQLLIETLFAWIRAALWNQQVENPVLTPEVCLRLFHLSKFQTVHSLIASAWLKYGDRMSRNDKLRAYFVYKTIKEENEALNNSIEKIAVAMEKHNVEYVIVKGQTVGVYYPAPEARIPGDIDIFISSRDLKRIDDVLKEEFGADLSPLNTHRHQSTEILGSVVEVHNRLVDLNSSKHRRYWDKIYSNCFQQFETVEINGKSVRTLDATRNVLYVFQHLYFHLLVMGIGLRQLVDLAILINSLKDQIDKQELGKHLHELGLYEAFCAIGWVLINKMGLDEDVFPFIIEERHKKYEKNIIKEIFKHGNFGKYNRKINRIGKLHTLETASIFIYHSFLFFRLSPREILMMIPRRLAICCDVLIKKLFSYFKHNN